MFLKFCELIHLILFIIRYTLVLLSINTNEKKGCLKVLYNSYVCISFFKKVVFIKSDELFELLLLAIKF